MPDIYDKSNNIETLSVFYGEREGWYINSPDSVVKDQDKNNENNENSELIREISLLFKSAKRNISKNKTIGRHLAPYRNGTGIDLKGSCRITVYYRDVPVTVLRDILNEINGNS